MFVVITLVAGDRSRTTSDGVSTFSTSILRGPAPLDDPQRPLALAGALERPPGSRRSRRRRVRPAVDLSHRVPLTARGVRPELDDWLWYAILPFAAYAAIVAAALWLRAGATGAFVALAAIVALLIFIGIRNAWDVVTYIAIKVVPGDGGTDAGGGTGPAEPVPGEPVPATVVANAALAGEPPPAG
jgi:hypothetical protein